MDKDSILEQARRERDQERARLVEAERAAAEARRPRTTSAAERLSVWWNLRREYHLGVGLLGALGLWFGFGLLPLDTKVPSAVCLVLGVLGSALLASSHRALRAWRTAISFEVRGWPELVDEPLFWIDERWRHVVVSLRGLVDDAERDALLQKLCERLGRTYYVPETPSDDARVRWKVVDGVARGSINRDGAHQLARWCLDDLRGGGFARRIDRVELSLDPDAFHVHHPSSD